jgi:hypothetical protein
MAMRDFRIQSCQVWQNAIVASALFVNSGYVARALGFVRRYQEECVGEIGPLAKGEPRRLEG